MSSRIRSDFGTLGDRLQRMKGEQAHRPANRHVIVDGILPGLLLGWQQIQGQWWGTVATAQAGKVELAILPAARVTATQCACCTKPPNRTPPADPTRRPG